MSEPKRLEVSVGSKQKPRPDRCGGALLRLSLDGIRELRKTGVRFDSVEKYGNENYDARVDCGGFIEVRGNTRDGLCVSCSRLETDVRAALRAKLGGAK